jgi:hypothetical protein
MLKFVNFRFALFTPPLGDFHQAIGFRPLELLTTGPPDSPVVHQTGPVHCLVRLLRLLWLLRAQSRTIAFYCSSADDRWRCIAVAPLGAPDSPVLHRTVRWIIRERPPQIPEGGKFRVELPGAPDQGCLWVVFCSLYLNPFLVFVLVCCEPLAPVKLTI